MIILSYLPGPVSLKPAFLKVEGWPVYDELEFLGYASMILAFERFANLIAYSIKAEVTPFFLYLCLT